MEAFIASIILFGGNFAPRGWAFCQGQLLPIAQYSALFTILGTTYGGDGQTTFALPDLRGRVPIHPGQGPGLSNRSLGERGGSETITLNVSQMPAHNHTLNAVTETGTVGAPAGASLAATGALDPEYRIGGTGVGMAASSIGVAGGSQPHTNMQPYLALNYIICLEGLYPSQS